MMVNIILCDGDVVLKKLKRFVNIMKIKIILCDAIVKLTSMLS